MDINSIYNMKFGGKKFNIRELYNLIILEFNQSRSEYKFYLNGKEFLIKIKKEVSHYKIEFSKKDILYLEKKEINFIIREKKFIHDIYCYENLISLLDYYKYNSPYIYSESGKIKINMDNKDEIHQTLSSFLKENQKIEIFEEEKEKKIKKYLVNKEKYEELKKFKISPVAIYDDPTTLFPKFFGSYILKYLKAIKEKDRLFFFPNAGMKYFQSKTTILPFEGLKNFLFLTGNDKSGKTFSLISLNRFAEEDYRFYLNFEYIDELIEQKSYEEIKKNFFYEISKIFISYEYYTDFAESFHGIIEKLPVFNFYDLLIKFIEEIEKNINNKNGTLGKLMIIFDNFELDTKNTKKFFANIKFINTLYEKLFKNSNINFTFVSPLNDNYIKKCVLLALDYQNTHDIDSPPKKDENKDIIYYPFYYYNSCLYDVKTDFENYKEAIKEKNKSELNISDKHLEAINYSLFHLNKIKEKCGVNPPNEYVTKKADEYLEILEKQINDYVLSFYSIDNHLYIFDLDKVENCYNWINTEVEYEKLIEILNFIPIKALDFYSIFKPGESEEKYIVKYINPFYGKSILNYLESFKNEDYDSKNYKPGQKGDILEEEVIKNINNGYFHNFKPNKIFEIDSIYKLRKYKYKKTYLSKEIELFEKIFSDKQLKLVMITQKHPNAKRYDVAFIHQYKKDKYQFILGQITRKKKKEEMEQYIKVKLDCYDFSDFFCIFNGVEVKKYHFIFIFQAGAKEDIDSMNFCNINRIKFIKFGIKNKQPFFIDSMGKIMDELTFDNNSFSLVEIIKNKQLDKLDNLTDFTKISRISKAKYFLGLNNYNKISKILGGKNFELLENYYFLSEDTYFHISYNKYADKKIFYLSYLKNGKEMCEIISDEIFNPKNDISIIVKTFELID